jgi:CheY-like chemotaxis protein/two-component sensor histidine kinase
MMERQISQMVRLVDDLLDVSRISRGKIELRKGSIELASAVNQAVEAARPLVESKSLDLSVSLPPKPIYLNGDPVRLAQIIGNLLNNACKFTNKGGRIWLTAELSSERDQSPVGVLIRVRDTGIGIAADQLPRIFEMFTQLDTSLERSVSGLGIGLTLAKNLVELHGGTIKVHSAGAGQGSEFVVRLPVSAEAPKPPPPEPASNELKTAPSRRILVVDDNEDSAESLTILLSLAGHKTHTAHDGLEAFEAAETFKPDVILLDIGLPKLNGYEVAHKIREKPWGQAMVLVALTGWGQDEDRRRSREAGFNHHLTKPVDPLALTNLLARLPLAQSAS